MPADLSAVDAHVKAREHARSLFMNWLSRARCLSEALFDGDIEAVPERIRAITRAATAMIDALGLKDGPGVRRQAFRIVVQHAKRNGWRKVVKEPESTGHALAEHMKRVGETFSVMLSELGPSSSGKGVTEVLADLHDRFEDKDEAVVLQTIGEVVERIVHQWREQVPELDDLCRRSIVRIARDIVSGQALRMLRDEGRVEPENLRKTVFDIVERMLDMDHAMRQSRSGSAPKATKANHGVHSVDGQV